MGKEVARLALEAGHEVKLSLDSASNMEGKGLTSQALSEVEVAIDFSRPAGVMSNIRRVAEVGVPIVVGTTGWYDGLREAREVIEEHRTALIYGANFSIGANLFVKLVEDAARLFEPFPDYDPYVSEHHHRDKADAPSGTALRLADVVLARTSRKTRIEAGNPKGKVPADALHVVSLRAGAAFGGHRVGFDGSADTVELVHTARNREGFARGALFAAEWIREKKGFYEFSSLLVLE
jgi:4-hydroxy-tetrahydrodipicolinate reductase